MTAGQPNLTRKGPLVWEIRTTSQDGLPSFEFDVNESSVRSTPVLPAPLNAKLYSTGVPPEVLKGLDVRARALSPMIKGKAEGGRDRNAARTAAG